jgi:hypothetical protein
MSNNGESSSLELNEKMSNATIASPMECEIDGLLNDDVETLQNSVTEKITQLQSEFDQYKTNAKDLIARIVEFIPLENRKKVEKLVELFNDDQGKSTCCVFTF